MTSPRASPAAATAADAARTIFSSGQGNDGHAEVVAAQVGVGDYSGISDLRLEFGRSFPPEVTSCGSKKRATKHITRWTPRQSLFELLPHDDFGLTDETSRTKTTLAQHSAFVRSAEEGHTQKAIKNFADFRSGRSDLEPIP